MNALDIVDPNLFKIQIVDGSHIKKVPKHVHCQDLVS